MKWHEMTWSDIEQRLRYNTVDGLTRQEAHHRLTEHGLNELAGKKPKTFLQRFLAQLADFMVIVLIIASVVSFCLAWYEGKDDFVEPIVIILIVILNAILGVVQENKAEKALAALKSMAAPLAKVVRDGQVLKIPAKELVPGDLILLEAGDFVPADARLVESHSLKSGEAALTGESLPVEKDADAALEKNAPLADRINMIYSGCPVVYGRGKAIVTDTGMNTEMGRIAKMLDAEEEGSTPLQKKLAQLGKYLAIAALAICVVIFIIGLTSGMALASVFMLSVSLAVAAIPEGLPAIVTIVLATGVTKMAKQNAIIRRLPVCETLGSASVICSDKTGTLTQNRMTVVKAWSMEGEPFDPFAESRPETVRMFQLAALCCDSKVEMVDGVRKEIGDPTELAIVVAAEKLGCSQAEDNITMPRMSELPFDSDRKLMTTIHNINGHLLAVVKGAPDQLFTRCSSGDIAAATAANEAMGRQALRVLAVAIRPLDAIPDRLESDEVENDLTLVGLIGMIDPPREEAKQAVATCVTAGIRTIMITGDHAITASAIATQLGILREGDRAITGAELNEMSEAELADEISTISVYARVSPEDKIKIVKAWQAQGHVVAMTGDGVNDAPALKAADIGCAMGITGTDVAKGAADMTLVDDNFATIVSAVQYGRGLYDNIKKSITFLTGSNIGEILVVLVGLLLIADSQHRAPLAAIQLLLINLVTDGLPALALGMEPAEKDVMNRKPRPSTESIFAGGMVPRMIFQGVMIAALTLIAFIIGYNHGGIQADHDTAQTMAFLVLALSQLFHAFNMRTYGSIFKHKLSTNKYMLAAFAGSALLILMIALIPPLAGVFKLVPLDLTQWAIAVGLSAAVIPIVEIGKLIGRLFKNK